MKKIILSSLTTALVLSFLFGYVFCKKLRAYEDSVLYVKEGGTNRKGERMYCYVDRFDQMWIPTHGKPVSHYGFTYADPFCCGLALVTDINGKRQYIDKEGNVVIDASDYDDCMSFENIWPHNFYAFPGLAFVYKNDIADKGDGRYEGLINTKGEVVLPPEYDTVMGWMVDDEYNYYGTRWWVKKDGLYGVINRKAKFVIPLQYEEYEPLIGMAGVKKGGYWGVIDHNGKVRVPFQYVNLKSGYPEHPDCFLLYREDGSRDIWNTKTRKFVK